jgi:polyisoprenoid-binding protein YceI
MTHGRLLSALLVSLFVIAGAANAATWEIDKSHSTVGFKIRHMMVSNVRGNFKEFSGELAIDEKDISKSAAQITINPATIDTDDVKRDEHLKSADFFDVATNKDITFKSTKFVKGKGKSFKIVGDLTMHGVTKEVTFNVDELTPPQKGMREKLIRGLSATGSVNRKDFNMVWNKSIDKGGLAVGDKVDVNVELELIEKTAEAPKVEEKKS